MLLIVLNLFSIPCVQLLYLTRCETWFTVSNPYTLYINLLSKRFSSNVTPLPPLLLSDLYFWVSAVIVCTTTSDLLPLVRTHNHTEARGQDVKLKKIVFSHLNQFFMNFLKNMVWICGYVACVIAVITETEYKGDRDTCLNVYIYFWFHYIHCSVPQF